MRVDVVVVGGGHAGCEAAHAAARLGSSVLLVTLDARAVGRLSCNPAMGGLAKGCLVREIDALGGVMARVTDATTVQFRHLNTRKGLAVRASRAQVDAARYPAYMSALLRSVEGLTIVESEVTGLLADGGRVRGVELRDGTRVEAAAVVMTTGTFLGGVMHRGPEQTVGGRVGERASTGPSGALRRLGLRLGRLKTGTPPRVARASIDTSRLEPQDDVLDGRFSFAPAPPRPGSVVCWATSTTAATHDLIRASLSRSPVYAGAITGRGPRYCPSVEDKVVRFPDKDRHLIFLEPEGLDTDRVYVAGLSTSLPPDAQAAILRTIPGLEHAVALQWGYAVEYDWVDPTQLDHDLAVRGVAGLYCAGQIAGTSGYEEAAAQGLVAGFAAAGRPLRPRRDEGYIGVLVDDLVTRGVGDEPYRMFPSRAEHRLLLREDNADRRLTPRGRALGLVDDASWARFEAKLEAIERLRARWDGVLLRPNSPESAALGERGQPELTQARTVLAYLRRPDVDAAAVARVLGDTEAPDVVEQVEIDTRYEGYVARAEHRRADAARLEGASLDPLDLATVPVSSEVRERLLRHRPATLGAASRLPGVTPAAMDTLAAALVIAGARR